MAFRALVLCGAAACWALTLWLATHENEQAAILSRYSTSYFVVLLFMLAVSIATTATTFGAGWRWIHRNRTNVLLLAVSTVASLTLVELFVRIADPIGISYYAHAKDYHFDKVADDELYYRHRPGLDRVYQGVRVQTNDLGMRDAAVGPKQAGEFRILWLGDSVTFGWGAAADDIFAARVGQRLTTELGFPVRTINSGVGSYNTTQQLATLRRFGDRLAPDIVALLYVGNDIEPAGDDVFDPWSADSFSGKSPPQILRLLLGKSWTYRLVSHIRSVGGGGAASGTPTAGRSTASEGWQQSEAALRDIAAWCDAAGIPFVVFLYRMTPTPLEDDLDRELARLSVKLGFHYEDVLPWFGGSDTRSLINSPVDSHPNADGHAILTDGMVATLRPLIVTDRP